MLTSKTSVSRDAPCTIPRGFFFVLFLRPKYFSEDPFFTFKPFPGLNIIQVRHCAPLVPGDCEVNQEGKRTQNLRLYPITHVTAGHL